MTGGNIGTFGPGWQQVEAPSPRSCLLPVCQGFEFGVGFYQNVDGQQMDASCEFRWISQSGGGFTAAKSGRSAFVPPPLPQSCAVVERDREGFIALLERMIGKPIDEETQKQLLALGPAL